MKLAIFRRRAVTPADLAAVSAATVPGPLTSGLTSSTLPLGLTPSAALGEATRRAAAAQVESDRAATANPAREPQASTDPITGLAPLEARPPLWRPGTYTVTYSRIGDHGRRGSGLDAPMPLTAEAPTSGDLARIVAEDVHQLTGLTVSVMVDEVAGGGTIIGEGGRRVGTFAYEKRGALK